MVFFDNNQIITAGHDGYIKFWDFPTIDAAEGDDKSRFFLKPLREVKIFSKENVSSLFFCLIFPFPSIRFSPKSSGSKGPPSSGFSLTQMVSCGS